MRKGRSLRQIKKENKRLHEELAEAKSTLHYVKEESLQLSFSQQNYQHTHNVTVSDLPPPDVFDKYPDELKALILKRIETDMNNDKELIELEKGEQKIRNKEVEGEISLRKRGQYFAMFSLVFLMFFAAYFASIDSYKIAGVIVGTVVLGTITAFTGFSQNRNRKQTKNNKNKTK